MESYTDTELDHLIGSTLFTGGLHNAIGNFLDVTRFRQDVELIQWINHMPIEPATEIVEGTILGIHEMQKRLQIVLGAFEAAAEVLTQRAADESGAESDKAAFDEMMRLAFEAGRKKNGGA